MTKRLQVGIIGCGVIGNKRANAILELGQDRIAGVFDINQRKSHDLADLSRAKAYLSWQKLLNNPKIDSVIVATTTDVNMKIVITALKAGKHVLAEKPLGKNVKQAWQVNQAVKKAQRILKVGFNHRHHPAIFQAQTLVKQGVIGEIMYIRSIYGHGGRPGYDLDWRMQKKYSPGGELLDQGVHIIDLANWFLGNFSQAFALTRNFFWKKSVLEDNAFCQLLTKQKQIVDFHVSITQWKNKFSFEVFGNKGYLAVNGLGKSYGVETLTLGTQVGQGKVPKEKVSEFFGPDLSWQEEWKEFRNAIWQNRQPLANATDNLVVNKILESLYLSSKKGKITRIG